MKNNGSSDFKLKSGKIWEDRHKDAGLCRSTGNDAAYRPVYQDNITQLDLETLFFHAVFYRPKWSFIMGKEFQSPSAFPIKVE